MIPADEVKAGRHRVGALARTAHLVDCWLTNLEKVLVFLLLTSLTLAVLLQVVSRHLLAEPNPWTEELARYLFVWMSMLGASIATQMRAHFGLEMLLKNLPVHLRVVAAVLAWLVVAGTAASFAFYGWAFVSMTSLSTGPATDLPMSWIHAAIPVGMSAIVVHLVLGAIYRPLHDLEQK